MPCSAPKPGLSCATSLQLVALGKLQPRGAQGDSSRRPVSSIDRLERGILQLLHRPGRPGGRREERRQLMLDLGVERHVLTTRGGGRRRTRARALSPAPSCGGVYTPTDESGDARVFTQALAETAAPNAAPSLPLRAMRSTASTSTRASCTRRQAARARAPAGRSVVTRRRVRGCHGLLHGAAPSRQVGVDLDIYPTKGYSATLAAAGASSAPALSA